MPTLTTEELEARQLAALTKNNDRKKLIADLGKSLADANAEVARLAAAGQQVDALSAALTKSNALLQQLQDEVLSDDVTPDPVPEPEPETPVEDEVPAPEETQPQ